MTEDEIMTRLYVVWARQQEIMDIVVPLDRELQDLHAERSRLTSDLYDLMPPNGNI